MLRPVVACARAASSGRAVARFISTVRNRTEKAADRAPKMPPKAEYISRIPDAIRNLRRSSDPVAGRMSIESAFGISKATALRLLDLLERMGLKSVGWADLGFLSRAPGAKPLKLYLRSDLVSALERLQAGEAPEIGRRHRLRAALEPLAESARLRSIEVAPAGPASDRLRAARELPAGVRFEAPADGGPARMVLEFVAVPDFLGRLGVVVYALQNDFEGVISHVSEVLRTGPGPV